MNKKVLVIFVALVALAMLATPVFAFGPENALGKNPNIIGPAPYGYDVVLDNGIVHSFMLLGPVPMMDWYKDARYFKINNAFVVTNPAQPFGMENKWMYLSQDMLYQYWVLAGMPEGMAAYLSSLNPEGVYNKWNLVGQ